MDKRIGTITIIITNRTSQAENVNAILSEFGDVIIGRMGIPYSPKICISLRLLYMPPRMILAP